MITIMISALTETGAYSIGNAISIVDDLERKENDTPGEYTLGDIKLKIDPDESSRFYKKYRFLMGGNHVLQIALPVEGAPLPFTTMHIYDQRGFALLTKLIKEKNLSAVHVEFGSSRDLTDYEASYKKACNVDIKLKMGEFESKCPGIELKLSEITGYMGLL